MNEQTPAAPNKPLIMAGAMTALFLAAIDQTIVATSLSTMARDLNGWESMSWVVTAYLLSSIAVTPRLRKASNALSG